MNKQQLIFPLLFISFFSLVAQNENLYSLGARSSAMGNTSATLTDIWAVNNNQAALGFVTNSAIGLHYENRFLAGSLGYKSLAGAFATKSGTFGLKFNHFGYSTYSNIETGISFGKSFGEYFAAGIQINYLYTKLAQDYGSSGMAVSELGILSKPTKYLLIGAHVYNPTMSKFNNSGHTERIPTIFKVGASYIFDNFAMLSTEIVKDVDYPFIFRAGLEFNLAQQFVARAGISSNNSLISFGAGYRTSKINIDFAFSYHSYLGYSPFITMVYNFNKE